MKIELFNIGERSHNVAILYFTWEGTIPKRSEWFICTKNGGPETINKQLTTAQKLMHKLDVPVTSDIEVQIVVSAPNGWRYAESNSVSLHVNEKQRTHYMAAFLNSLRRRFTVPVDSFQKH